jgi:hypothetical protein
MSSRSRRGQSKDFCETKSAATQKLQDGDTPIHAGGATTATGTISAQVKSVLEETIASDKQLMATIALAVADSLKSQLEESPSLLNRIVSSICQSNDLVDKITASITERVTQNLYQSLSMDDNLGSSKMSSLEKQQSHLVQQNATLEDKIDELEQYSRRNCLLIHGVKEGLNESTDQLVIDTINHSITLDAPVKIDDIDRSHRLGRPKEGSEASRPRPIIIKFCSYRRRSDVFRNKKQLKNTGKLITENLTIKRQKLMIQAASMEAVDTTWSMDGRIICLLNNKKRVTVTKHDDLKRLT